MNKTDKEPVYSTQSPLFFAQHSISTTAPIHAVTCVSSTLRAPFLIFTSPTRTVIPPPPQQKKPAANKPSREGRAKAKARAHHRSTTHSASRGRGENDRSSAASRREDPPAALFDPRSLCVQCSVLPGVPGVEKAEKQAEKQATQDGGRVAHRRVRVPHHRADRTGTGARWGRGVDSMAPNTALGATCGRQGAFAKVWKAYCESKKAYAAIKIMDLEKITTSFEDIRVSSFQQRLSDRVRGF